MKERLTVVIENGFFYKLKLKNTGYIMTFQNVLANQVLFCYQWGRLIINKNTEFVVVKLTYFVSSDRGL